MRKKWTRPFAGCETYPTAWGTIRPSVVRRRAVGWNRCEVEMGGGIHGIARPYVFPVLIEGDPFAVADAVGAREDFVMAVRTVQRKGRVGCGPVVAAR